MLWWSLVEFRCSFVRQYNGRNLDGLGLSLRNRKLWEKTRRGHVAHIPVIRLTSCKTESFTIPWDLYFRWKLFNSRSYFDFRKLFVKAKRPRTYDTLSFSVHFQIVYLYPQVIMLHIVDNVIFPQNWLILALVVLLTKGGTMQ